MKEKYSDIEIIQGIKENNELYLKVLYNNNQIKKLIINHIISNNGTLDEAIDTYQETIIFLYNKLESTGDFILTSSLSTYLFGVAKYKWLKQLKKNSNTFSLPYNENEYLKYEEDNGFKEDRIKLIESMIGKLNTNCKELLTQFYFYKKTMKELASFFNYSNEDSAKAMKHKCMKNLKELIVNNNEL